MEKIEMMNKLIENLGVEKALEELVDALSDDEMRSNFEFICRMNDIPMDEEEEEKNKKITLKEFFENDEKLAIHCNTKEKAQKLCEAFNKMGKKWSGAGDKSYLKSNYWQFYEEETCYSNKGRFCNKGFYLNKNCKVYEFEDVKIEE